MRQAFAAAMLATLALTASARAADLPRRGAPPPLDYYAPTPVYNWQGFYAGVQGGVGFSSFTDGPFDKPVGGLIGLTGGYNYIAAPNLLIGVETDFTFSGMSASRDYWGAGTRNSVDDIWTVRGRVGYLIDRALIYATGGFAASLNNVTVGSWYPAFWGNESRFQTGWTAGAGLEFMVSDRISAKGEYLFTSVGPDTYFNITPFASRISVDTSLVRAGVNYHF